MEYGEPEAELLQEVANQLALAIENMREYQEIGRLKAQLERENIYLREEILGEHNFEEIVGGSPRSGPCSTWSIASRQPIPPCSILGETGTGKELVARAIHSREPAPQAAARQSELRRHRRRTDRERAVRPRERCVHRRDWSGARDGSSWPIAARYSSTRSASCRSRCK